MTAGLEQQIAARVRILRTARGLSLEALAERSGVSRSMISLIERGEASPTAVLLEKLATGLDVPLVSLFEAPSVPARPVARRDEQTLWRDPASGYLRRNVSPSGFPSAIQIVEVEFPPGAQVAYESGARPTALHQQVWLFEGKLEVTVGSAQHELAAGDCLALALDQPVAYRNRGKRPARYAVVIAPARSAREAF